MSKLALTISYLGTHYSGWQVQPNAPSIQQTLGEALDLLFGCKCTVTGCSRTDSGVHAHEFLCVVGFGGEYNHIPPDRVPQAINTILPDDISVLSCEECPDDFHPRYGIRGKEYIYLILNSRIRDPFLSGRACQIPQPLDEGAMNTAAKEFIGYHDFGAFMAAGSKITDTRRTVFDAKVERQGDMLTFTVSADGFLYNMVRIMVGTLIEAGKGKLSPADIRGLLTHPDRANAGATVPPHGLYLNRILKGARENEA